MSEQRPYLVTVTLRDGDGTSLLLSVVSTLHRRATAISNAEMRAPAHGLRVFKATISATERQAATLRASLDNLIDVLDVALDHTITTRDHRRCLASTSLQSGSSD
ncbi:MAG TPA: hypothetical protein VHO27_13300 [Angustibacter sp.]|nr:hypothetical protein [Angustibacter sp.]